MTTISSQSRPKVKLRKPVLSLNKQFVKYFDNQDKKFKTVEVVDSSPENNLFVRVAEQMNKFAFNNGGKIDRKTATIMIGNISKSIRGHEDTPAIKSIFDNYLNDDGYITQNEQFEIMSIVKKWCELSLRDIDE